MRLVTWNLNGLDDMSVDERAEAAVFTAVLGMPLDELHRGAQALPAPDVILLQEVVPRTFNAHLVPHLGAGGYMLWPPEGRDRETFEVCAVRSPFSIEQAELVPLADSQFDRRATVLSLKGPTTTFRIVTAHFDSGKDSGAIRVKQLQQVAKLVGPNGVFAGDANLRKAEWEQVRDLVAVTDAWEALGEPPSTRYTWRRDMEGESYKARFDRVLLGAGLKAVSMAALGAKPLFNSTYISDHIGLAVEIQPA